MVQWLGLCAGAKVLQAVWCGKKTKQANKKQRGQYTRHVNKSRAASPAKLFADTLNSRKEAKIIAENQSKA